MVDVFFSSEDAHKVGPLLHFLDMQDLDVVQRDHAIDSPSSPYLVIVSEHAPEQKWLADLMASEQAICVLISSAPVPPQARTLDLRSWPARSADRTLASFAEWMRTPSTTATPQWASTNQTTPVKQTSERQSLGVVVTLVAIFAGLFWLSYNQSTETTEAAQRKEEIEQRTADTSIETVNGGIGVDTAPNSTIPHETDTVLLTADPLYSQLDSKNKETNVRAWSQLDVQSAVTQRECLRRWALSGRIEQCWAPLKGPASWLSEPIAPSASAPPASASKPPA